MWNAVGNGAYNKYPTNLPDFQYALSVVPKHKNRGVIPRGAGPKPPTVMGPRAAATAAAADSRA